MNPHSWQARAKRRDLRVNADIATAVVLADEASEIQRRARKSLDAAAELCKVLEDHQK